MAFGLFRQQHGDKGRDRRERDQQARDVGRGQVEHIHADRRRRHRCEPDRKRRLAVGVGDDMPDPNGADQQLQQYPHHHRLARRDQNAEQRHEDDRHAEPGQPAHIGGPKGHRRRADERQRREAEKMRGIDHERGSFGFSVINHASGGVR